MAWALQFDGVNDYAEVTPTQLHSQTGRIEYEYLLDLFFSFGQSQVRLLGNSNSTGYLFITSTGVTIRYGSSNGSQVDISVTIPFDDDYHLIKITRLNDDYKIYVDGDLGGTATSQQAAEGTTISNVGRIGTTVTPITKIKSIIFKDTIGGTDLFNWDATASSHAAGTPILTDTVGGNDATGVNMPTDGSAWVDLGGSGTTVTTNQVAQAQTIDQVTLTEHSVLTVGGLSQAQTVEQVTLQQSGTLSVNNLQHIQTIDQVNLTQAHIVSVNDLSQLQNIDQVSLNQGNVLSVNDTDQLQTLGQVTLSAAGTVAINNASQVQSLEQLVLSIAGTIAINNLSQSQLLEQLNLTQAHVVSVDNLSQAQLLESINFNGVVVGYLQGALTIVSAYNGQIKLTNPLTGEIRIL
tara:strand:- start:847 stop:2067 length:1221 start_codon:yes stop_codon:yes gene_type:complete